MIMAYDKIEPSAKPIIIIYIIMLIAVAIMTILLYRKWKERKTPIAKHLTIAFLIYFVITSVLTWGLGDALITGEKRIIYQISLGFGYAASVIASNFILLFIADLINMNHKKLKKFYVISIILAILLLLPNNYYGVTVVDPVIPEIRLYTSAAMLLYLMGIYGWIAILMLYEVRRIDESYAKIGFAFIACAQIAYILSMLFFLSDVVVFTTTGGEGNTFFVYLADLSLLLWFIFNYLGLILPAKLKKKAEEEKITSNEI